MAKKKEKVNNEESLELARQVNLLFEAVNDFTDRMIELEKNVKQIVQIERHPKMFYMMPRSDTMDTNQRR